MIFENITIVAAIVQVGVVIGMSVAVIIHYAQHRAMRHITYVATSYIGLTILVAGSIIFQIFTTGQTRIYGLVLAMIFFALGDYALIVVWRARKRPSVYPRIISEFEGRQNQIEQRLVRVETVLNITGDVKVEDVRIIEGLINE